MTIGGETALRFSTLRGLEDSVARTTFTCPPASAIDRSGSAAAISDCPLST